jgi:hypothetical protein
VNDSIAFQVSLHNLVRHKEQAVTQVVRVLLNLAALSIGSAVSGASHSTVPTVSRGSIKELVFLAVVKEHNRVSAIAFLNLCASKNGLRHLLYFNDLHGDSPVCFDSAFSSVQDRQCLQTHIAPWIA